METRWYFILGDIAANCLVAIAAVALTSLLVGGALGMIPGMIVGMLLGMAVALVIGMGFLAPLLGVMEVISPCMLSGMAGGMFGAMFDLSGMQILQWGAATGVAMLAIVYLLNALLSGPQRLGDRF